MFPDGQLPDDELKKKWLDIVNEFFDGPDSDKVKALESNVQ